MSGINAFSISDADLLKKGEEMIVIRISPDGIVAGSADPGGKLWLWVTIITIVFVFAVVF